LKGSDEMKRQNGFERDVASWWTYKYIEFNILLQVRPESTYKSDKFEDTANGSIQYFRRLPPT
jgi:hypothetical protein